MKKFIHTILLIIFTSGLVSGQDLIYTISGELNKNKVPIDSILIENLSNNTWISFDDIPEQSYYQINLTKKAYWGTTGIPLFENDRGFIVTRNIPGLLILGYRNNIPAEANITVFNIAGQMIYSAKKKVLDDGNSLKVQVGSTGIFLVKIDLPFVSQTFKVIGFQTQNNFEVDVIDEKYHSTLIKSALIPVNADFGYSIGDSIRISVFKDKYSAESIKVIITEGKSINFIFEQTVHPIITDIGTPTGVLSDATIGPAGGTLHSADGKLTVTIPAGALSSATEISIQPVTNEAPLGLGSGYRLQPDGITFANPVQLTFHYDEQLLNESPEDFLWIVTQVGDGSWNAMLKSVLDKNAKTVTITTTHFSDWVLGKFVGFTLTPSSSAIQKGKSVQLRLTGFARDRKSPPTHESATLVYIDGDPFELEGYGNYPDYWESQSFKVKQWAINGVVAPVSNSNGSLQVSDNSRMYATYTAPNKLPAKNPVKISVELQAINAEGDLREFYVMSEITVVDDDFYLLVKIDGQELEYYQNDSSLYTLIYCFVDEGHFQIIAEMETASSFKNIFTLAFSNPSVTTRILNGPTGQSENLSFTPFSELGGYTLNYEQRTLKEDSSCVRKDQYGNATATLTEYAGIGSIARGSFSGTLYEDNNVLKAQCEMPIAHSIEGIFSLMVQP